MSYTELPSKYSKQSSREERYTKRSTVMTAPSHESPRPVYGKPEPVTIEHEYTFNVTDSKWSDSWHMHELDFGSEQLFSEPYLDCKKFQEYRIIRAHFKLSHTIVRVPETQRHYKSVFNVASFLLDHELEIEPDSPPNDTWDEFCSHPEIAKSVRTTIVSRGVERDTYHLWLPTDPEDTRWRLTDTDGLCHLYVMAKRIDKVDGCSLSALGHQVSTTAVAKFEIQLRTVNMQVDDSSRSTISPSIKSLSPQEVRARSSQTVLSASPRVPQARLNKSLENLTLDQADASDQCGSSRQ